MKHYINEFINKLEWLLMVLLVKLSFVGLLVCTIAVYYHLFIDFDYIRVGANLATIFIFIKVNKAVQGG